MYTYVYTYVYVYVRIRFHTTVIEWKSTTSDTNVGTNYQCPMKKKYFLQTKRETMQLQNKGNCTRFPETCYFASNAGKYRVLFHLKVCL